MIRYLKYTAIFLIIFSMITTSSAYAKKPVKLSSKQMGKVQGAFVAGYIPPIIVAPITMPTAAWPIDSNRTNVNESRLDKNQTAILGLVGGLVATEINPVAAIKYFGSVCYDTYKAGMEYRANGSEQDKRCIDTYNTVNMMAQENPFAVPREYTDQIISENCSAIGGYEKARGDGAVNSLSENAPDLAGDLVSGGIGKGLKETKMVSSPFWNRFAKESIKTAGGDFTENLAESYQANDSLINGTLNRLACEYSKPEKQVTTVANIFIPSMGSQLNADFRNGVSGSNVAIVEYGKINKIAGASSAVYDLIDWGVDKTKENGGQGMCIAPNEYFDNLKNNIQTDNITTNTSTIPPKTTTTYIASHNSGGSGGGGGGNRTGGSGGAGGGSGSGGSGTTINTTTNTKNTITTSSNNTVGRASSSNINEARNIAVTATPTNNLSNASATTRAMMSNR